jgi:threonine/homoserine/homoserine lactone efflux protein
VSLGRRAALATVIANAAGEYVQVIAVACGVGATVQRSLIVFSVIRALGAGYLVFLGVQAIRHRLGAALGAAVTPKTPARIVREGFIVGLTNPKSIVFFAAILPQFVNPALGQVWAQLLVLGLIFVAIALVSDSTWGLLAGSAGGWFARSPRRLEAVGGASGLVIIGLGVNLAVNGRRN